MFALRFRSTTYNVCHSPRLRHDMVRAATGAAQVGKLDGALAYEGPAGAEGPR